MCSLDGLSVCVYVGVAFPFKYTLVNIHGVKPHGRLPETAGSCYFFLVWKS